ncbi:MAG: class I SAM-dependent methyltransferase [Candidatus Daviesbacteria bacterium]|nr:class I SAM-dependent methyltransferase [Candidatus Daviesbacteria bacterium]
MSNDNGTQTLESMSQAVWYNHWTLQKFAKFLRGDILEVGCGTGNFTDELTKYGSVWAIDINQDYVLKTKEQLTGKAQVGLGDIEKNRYFFGDQKFDSIVCLNVLEHIEDDQSALTNLFNLLKVGGRLILLIPVHQFLYGEIDKSIGHVRRYDKSKICNRLKKIGFKIEFSKKLNFIGALGWLIAGKILKEATVKKGNIKLFNLVAPLFLRFENFIEPPIGTSILIVAQKP